MSRAEDLTTLSTTLLAVLRQIRDNPPDSQLDLVLRCTDMVAFGETMLALIETKELVR